MTLRQSHLGPEISGPQHGTHHCTDHFSFFCTNMNESCHGTVVLNAWDLPFILGTFVGILWPPRCPGLKTLPPYIQHTALDDCVYPSVSVPNGVGNRQPVLNQKVRQLTPLVERQSINLSQRLFAEVVSLQSVHHQFIGAIFWKLHLTPAGTLCRSELPITAVGLQA